jgi:hypothetical protein
MGRGRDVKMGLPLVESAQKEQNAKKKRGSVNKTVANTRKTPYDIWFLQQALIPERTWICMEVNRRTKAGFSIKY